MRRKSTHNVSKEKIQEKERKPLRKSPDDRDRGATQTLEKDRRKSLVSEPHRRISTGPLVSQRKRKVQRSDQKKYKEMKLLYNVRVLQKSTSMMIPRLPFRRVVREVAQEVSDSECKWQPSALDALQYSAEDFMTNFFADSFACTEHAKRVTLMSKDLALARRIRGNRDPSNW